MNIDDDRFARIENKLDRILRVLEPLEQQALHKQQAEEAARFYAQSQMTMSSQKDRSHEHR